MAAMTSFHAEKCRRLASNREVCAAPQGSSMRQFLIYNTLVRVKFIYCFASQRFIEACRNIVPLRPVHTGNKVAENGDK